MLKVEEGANFSNSLYQGWYKDTQKALLFVEEF